MSGPRDYLVGIQIIEVWNVWVTASSEDGAIEQVYDMMSDDIREQGKLTNCETDYATVITSQACESPEEDEEEEYVEDL